MLLLGDPGRGPHGTACWLGQPVRVDIVTDRPCWVSHRADGRAWMHGGVALVGSSGSARSLLPRRVQLLRRRDEARAAGGRGLLVVNPWLASP